MRREAEHHGRGCIEAFRRTQLATAFPTEHRPKELVMNLGKKLK
jgi:hypothetical protein